MAASVWILGLAATFVGPQFVQIRFRDKWMPLLLIALCVIVARYPLLTLMRRYVNPGMVLMLIWALMSAAWAPSPAFVLTQSISIIGVSLIALAFSLSGWDSDRFERLLAGVLTVAMIASVLAALISPQLAIHSENDVSLLNSWRGIAYQKNGLGVLAAASLIVWTYLWAARRTEPMISGLGILLSVFLLVKSRSSTSLMIGLLSSIGTLLILRPSFSIGWLGRRIVLGSMAILIPLGIYGVIWTDYFGFVGAFFGKDGSFSGRTLIWDAMLLEIARRPWFGTGLSSFWGGMDAGEARVRLATQWAVRNGHNGYIDILNELGLIGLALFLVFAIYHCVGLARLARVSRRHCALHLPLFVFLVLSNISESGWFFPISTTHLLGMYSSLEVSRLLLGHSLHVWRMQGLAAAEEVSVHGARPLSDKGMLR